MIDRLHLDAPFWLLLLPLAALPWLSRARDARVLPWTALLPPDPLADWLLRLRKLLAALAIAAAVAATPTPPGPRIVIASDVAPKNLKGFQQSLIARLQSGIVVGLTLGNLCGESLCGMVLKSFGADSFRFVINWGQVMAGIPIVILGVAILAVWAGISQIGQIKAYECCRGKE